MNRLKVKIHSKSKQTQGNFGGLRRIFNRWKMKIWIVSLFALACVIVAHHFCIGLWFDPNAGNSEESSGPQRRNPKGGTGHPKGTVTSTQTRFVMLSVCVILEYTVVHWQQHSGAWTTGGIDIFSSTDLWDHSPVLPDLSCFPGVWQSSSSSRQTGFEIRSRIGCCDLYVSRKKVYPSKHPVLQWRWRIFQSIKGFSFRDDAKGPCLWRPRRESNQICQRKEDNLLIQAPRKACLGKFSMCIF